MGKKIVMSTKRSLDNDYGFFFFFFVSLLSQVKTPFGNLFSEACAGRSDAFDVWPAKILVTQAPQTAVSAPSGRRQKAGQVKNHTRFER